MSNKSIIWESKYKKWLCYDDHLIDAILQSTNFVAPPYDLSSVEKRFSIDLPCTREVIYHLPIAHEGTRHENLRKRMFDDIYKNTPRAIDFFSKSIEKRISDFSDPSGRINIAVPIMQSILESNLALADIELAEDFDYSDLTLILDESQSIKSRIKNENLIKKNYQRYRRR